MTEPSASASAVLRQVLEIKTEFVNAQNENGGVPDTVRRTENFRGKRGLGHSIQNCKGGTGRRSQRMLTKLGYGTSQ